MERIVRNRYLNKEEIDKYNKIREQVEKEFPKLISSSSMKISGTGHRPQGLGLDYSEQSNQLLTKFCTQVLLGLKEKYGQIEIISGASTGFDQSWAEAGISLNVSVTLAIPFFRFGDNWPQSGKDRLNKIITEAQDVQYVSKEEYKGPNDYKDRDKWMVDNSDVLVALYSGLTKSGTAMTIRYAEKCSKAVIFIWEDWIKFKSS